MSLRFAIFLAVIISLLGAINLFVYRRLSRALRLERKGRSVVGAVLAVGLASMIGARLVGPDLVSVAVVLGGMGAAIELGVLIAFALLVSERAARGLVRVGQRMARKPSPEPESPPLARRDLLEGVTAVSAIALGGGASTYAALFGRHDFTIEEEVTALGELPPALEGFVIAQLSDLHLGTYVREWEIQRGLEMVGRTKPDAIVLTGDLLDHDPRYAPSLASFVRRLGEFAPVYAIVGNHDHYAGVRPVLEHLAAGGAEVLHNRHVVLGAHRVPTQAAFGSERGIVLAGVDDVWGRRRGRTAGPDLALALEGARQDGPRVLLAHNPVFFPEAAGSIDLQLSGHTHGGQFNPGIRPADLVLPYGYVEG
ncbi:MAG: metallophosphoesterase, partial [Myxococcota bacterium]